MLAAVSDGGRAALAGGNTGPLEGAVEAVRVATASLLRVAPERAAVFDASDTERPARAPIDLSGWSREFLSRLTLRLGFRMVQELLRRAAPIDPGLDSELAALLDAAPTDDARWFTSMPRQLLKAVRTLDGQTPERTAASVFAFRLAELLVPVHLALASDRPEMSSVLLGAAGAGWERLAGLAEGDAWARDVATLTDRSDLQLFTITRVRVLAHAIEVGRLANTRPLNAGAVLHLLDSIRHDLERYVDGPLETTVAGRNLLAKMDDVIRRTAVFLGLDPEAALHHAKAGTLETQVDAIPADRLEQLNRT